MNKQKQKAMKNKLKGTIQEAQGILTDDKQLELKGKARQNLGKAYGIVGDLQDQTEDVKEKVVDTVKEKTGQAQKACKECDTKEKVLFGLGIFSLLMFVIGLLVTFGGDDEY